MGCAISKEGQNRGRGGEGGLNLPLPRSFSMPVHHPAEKKGDSYHVVALTSSTYGILKMDPVKEIVEQEDYLPRKEEYPHGFYSFRKNLDRSSEMAAKTWSEVNNLLLNYKPFKGNLTTKNNPSSQEEPETINTWELMEGLEDSSPLTVHHGYKKSLDRSFSFHTVKDVEQLARDEPKVSIWHRVTPGVRVAEENTKNSKMSIVNLKNSVTDSCEMGNGVLLAHQSENGFRVCSSPTRMDSPSTPSDAITRPVWMQSTDDSTPALFDPDLISTFRKALEEISPRDPTELVSETSQDSSISCNGNEDTQNGPPGRFSRLRSGSFQARLNSFQQRIDEGMARNDSFSKKSPQKKPKLRAPPGGEGKVVLYFTSLRGIRKTFEDCCTVKLILQGFRVLVDERDISMHAQFRQELQDLLGKPMTVPRLFIGGKYIGGAEDIQQLHEVGELAKYLEGFPVQTSLRICDGCGDMRFVPCLNCDGSCKLFTEEGELIRCQQCNENGLIRCPVCC
eukprot:Gb_01609 [translate_table: standard]